MMTPARLDLRVWRNSPFPAEEFQIIEDGEPMDLTDLSLLFQVRQYDGAPGEPLIECASNEATGDRLQVLDAVNGLFRLHISQPTHEAIPSVAPPLGEPNKPLTLRHDLKIGSGEDYSIYWFGDYILQTGVVR